MIAINLIRGRRYVEWVDGQNKGKVSTPATSPTALQMYRTSVRFVPLSESRRFVPMERSPCLAQNGLCPILFYDPKRAIKNEKVEEGLRQNYYVTQLFLQRKPPHKILSELVEALFS